MTSRAPLCSRVFGFLFLFLFSSLLGMRGARAETQDAAGVLQRFAIIIGANDGGAGRERLRYADSDARAMAGVHGQLGGLRAQDTTLLIEPKPRALLTALEQLGARISESRAGRPKDPAREPAGKTETRTELLFYYSGHSDEQGLLLGSERLPYPTLRAAIERVSADVAIAILDSCSAGAFTRLKGGTQRPPFLVDISVRVSGHAFLASSSANEAAQESDRIGSSFFTYYFISGLRGAADVSGDGRVTLNEAYNFAFNETLARTERTLSGAQHPAYDIQLAGTGDVVLTDLRDPSARLTLARELQGRIYVRALTGVLAAELSKYTGAPVLLALQPGSYRITVERDGRFYKTQVEIGANQTVSVGSSALSPVAAERTLLRGGEDLTWVPANLSLIPKVSINNLFGDRVVNNFSFNLLAGRATRLFGLEMAMLYSTRTEDALGLQIAGGANIVGGMQIGGQLAMGVNVVGGDSLGIQFASVANIVRGNAAGINMSSALNLIGGDSWGLHMSAFDIVRGNFRGLQLAGLTAFSGGQMKGMQISTGIAQAGEMTGVQVAFINIGGDVHGLQFGFINIARTVHGMQLGLVNIAREVDGASIGLLSLVQHGTHTLEVYGSDVMPMNLGTKLGSKRAYGIFGVGIDPFRDTVRWSMGGGLGVQASLWRNLFLNVDAMAHLVMPDIKIFDAETAHLLTELRLLVGWQLLPRLALFLGPTLHVSATNNPGPDGAGAVSQFSGADRVWQTGATFVRFGPGLTGGIRAF